ncbi:MAG: molybdopterin-dependent oxidoreductase [Noviherbaspirillum sp.]
MAGFLAAGPVRAQGSATLSSGGRLVEAKTFSIDQLKQLPQTEIAESRSTERNGERHERRIVYRGVLARDVIQAAGFKENQRHDFRRTLFLAKATDGYTGLSSWGELFNSEAGGSVLVIIEADGKPLPASEGPIALRSVRDIRPGPRHIRWLREIVVEQVER